MLAIVPATLHLIERQRCVRLARAVNLTMPKQVDEVLVLLGGTAAY